jgi:hypothetical protein
MLLIHGLDILLKAGIMKCVFNQNKTIGLLDSENKFLYQFTWLDVLSHVPILPKRITPSLISTSLTN